VCVCVCVCVYVAAASYGITQFFVALWLLIVALS
jgi:hypothetical protein